MNTTATPDAAGPCLPPQPTAKSRRLLAQLIDGWPHVTVKIEHEHEGGGLAIILGLQSLLDGFALRFLFFSGSYRELCSPVNPRSPRAPLLHAFQNVR